MVARTRTAQDRERPRGSSSPFSALAVARLVLFLSFALVFAFAPSFARAVVWPWGGGDPWPTSSERVVEPLAHPPLELFLTGRDLSAGVEANQYLLFRCGAPLR